MFSQREPVSHMTVRALHTHNFLSPTYPIPALPQHGVAAVLLPATLIRLELHSVTISILDPWASKDRRWNPNHQHRVTDVHANGMLRPSNHMRL